MVQVTFLADSCGQTESFSLRTITHNLTQTQFTLTSIHTYTHTHTNTNTWFKLLLAPELCISPQVLIAETGNLVGLYIEAVSTLKHTHQLKYLVQVTFTTDRYRYVCVCVAANSS